MQTVSMSQRSRLLCSSSSQCVYTGLTFVFACVCSASTCHIQPSPCSSATTRKRGTLPLLIVCQHSGVIECFYMRVVVRALTLHLCVSLRYDGGGAGHSSGHCNPGTDSRRLLRMSHWVWCDQHKLNQHQQHVCSYTRWDGESNKWLEQFDAAFKWMFVQANAVFSVLQKQAYMIASGVICIIYVVCAAVLFVGVKEKKGMNPWNNKKFSSVQCQGGIFMFRAELWTQDTQLNLTKSKKTSRLRSYRVLHAVANHNLQADDTSDHHTCWIKSCLQHAEPKK